MYTSSLYKGVTLIELLVVIVLLGIAIALVGPFTMKQIDSSKARNEQLQLQRWMQKQSFQAFTSDSPIYLKFEGKAIYRSLLPGSALYQQEFLTEQDNGAYRSGYEGATQQSETAPQFNSFDDFLMYNNESEQNAYAKQEATLLFESLFFEPQILIINNHGYIDTQSLQYIYRRQKVSLNLTSLLTGTHDE